MLDVTTKLALEGFAEGKRKDAQDILRAHAKHPDHAVNAHFALGLIARELNKPRDAVVHFETALRLNPRHGASEYYLADSVFRAGQPELGVKVFSRLKDRTLCRRRWAAGMEEAQKLNLTAEDFDTRPVSERGIPEIEPRGRRNHEEEAQTASDHKVQDPDWISNIDNLLKHFDGRTKGDKAGNAARALQSSDVTKFTNFDVPIDPKQRDQLIQILLDMEYRLNHGRIWGTRPPIEKAFIILFLLLVVAVMWVMLPRIAAIFDAAAGNFAPPEFSLPAPPDWVGGGGGTDTDVVPVTPADLPPPAEPSLPSGPTTGSTPPPTNPGGSGLPPIRDTPQPMPQLEQIQPPQLPSGFSPSLPNLGN